MVSKSAVIGIDLGSADSFVGYVGKGVVDICQNEVSNRNTAGWVGFTDRERALGDTALAQIKSNAKNSCRNFKHLVGQQMDSPFVEAEHFWSTAKIVEADDGHPGYEVTYKGEQRVITAVQATAMFLTKLKDVAEQWTKGKVADCVIGVPSYYSDVHRQAVLDAAQISGISVLRLMNEHTATALAYGIYRSNDFDAEKPETVAFCSVGATTFSVSIVQFVKGKLTVVAEKSDKVGGRDIDKCLMTEFAAQFKKKTGCDALSNKKAAFKLEDSTVKSKKILSANNEAPVNVECLMEDEDFASMIKRDDMLEMCKPMMAKVQAVLEAVKATAGIPVEEIGFVEMVGGASRVPWIKEMCSQAFGGKALSFTMNADESVARGCALQAAMLSPLYKVRDFQVVEFSPYPINIGWMGSSADAEAKKDDDGDMPTTAAEGEYKTALVFPAGSDMNTTKMLTFYRKGPFDLTAEYADDKNLVVGTKTSLGTFKIDLPPQAEAKKIKVKAKLSLHGIFTIDGAQMVESEDYEETVKEKREVEAPAEAEASKSDAPPAEAPTDGKTPPAEAETKEEPKKEPEKKYEWVDVIKKKTRTKKTDLPVTATGRPGLSATMLQSRTDEETAMQAETREIIETDEKRNDLESYILTMREKTSDSGIYGPFIAQADRDTFQASLAKMEDWLYDTYDATKVQYVEQLVELKKLGDPVVWRHQEDSLRADWIQAVSGTISNYKNAAENPGEKYGHISPDKLASIVKDCDDVSKWLADLQAKQATLHKHEQPVLICADMEKKNQELAKMADVILKEPKPTPPPEPPKEETPAEAPKTDDGAAAAEDGAASDQAKSGAKAEH